MARAIDLNRVVRGTALRRTFARVNGFLDHPNVLQVLSFVAFATIWQIAAINVNPIFLPAPVSTAQAFVAQVMSGKLIIALLSTLYVLVLGYGSASILGIPLGLLIGRYRRLRHFASFYVNVLYAIPSIAFIPLMMMWLGLDLGPKVAITFLSAFFPILMNTQAGVANVDRTLAEVAASFGANERETLKDVVVPSCVPFVIAGLRIAVGRAIVGAVVAEFLTSPSGLGELLVTYGNLYQTANFFAPLILLGALSLGLTVLLERLEKRVERWKSVAG